MTKPDVILFCDFGYQAAAVTFRGTEIEHAVETASEPDWGNPAEINDVIAYYRNRYGYDHYRLLGEAYNARICVQRGFDVGTAESIAKLYLAMVREART